MASISYSQPVTGHLHSVPALPAPAGVPRGLEKHDIDPSSLLTPHIRSSNFFLFVPCNQRGTTGNWRCVPRSTTWRTRTSLLAHPHRCRSLQGKPPGRHGTQPRERGGGRGVRGPCCSGAGSVSLLVGVLPTATSGMVDRTYNRFDTCGFPHWWQPRGPQKETSSSSRSCFLGV